MRVLEWIIRRCEGRAGAAETAIGAVPRREDFDLEGLDDFTDERFAQATAVDTGEWLKEIDAQGELFTLLGERLPTALATEREHLHTRLLPP